MTNLNIEILRKEIKIPQIHPTTMSLDQYCFCDIAKDLQLPAPLNAILTSMPSLTIKYLLSPPLGLQY